MPRMIRRGSGRIMAIEGFGANGADALPALQKALSDSSERNRRTAAGVIQTIKAATSRATGGP
jgi:hypothetical protein